MFLIHFRNLPVREPDPDPDETPEPPCQHEDDGGPFFAVCRKCGAVLDDYAGGD